MLLLFALPVQAQEAMGETTSRPLPRFASLKGDKVYARTGPGTRYPIQWVYERADLPVEITQEFDTWRKIRDIEGEGGWIHQSLLSGKRYAMLMAMEAQPLLQKAQDDARMVAMVESHAVLELDSVDKNWCEVNASGFSGWIHCEFLWGVYEGEAFE